jgi:hypothetical protein
MAEQADAMVSNTIGRKAVRVRFPLRAPVVIRIPAGQRLGVASEQHEVPDVITDRSHSPSTMAATATCESASSNRWP